MGYQLRRDLREALGPDITGLQRAVALEIADDANDITRRSAAPLEDLARWTGAKDTDVVRNALKRLATAGWEFRVAIGKGKDGRVLYAVPGHRMTFLVPPFTLPQGVAVATPSEAKGERGLPLEGATATPSGSKGEPRLPLGGAGATPSQNDPIDEETAAQTGNPTDHDPTEGVATATPSTAQGGAVATPSSYKQAREASKQAGARDPIPDFARPLVDRISASGVHVRWGFRQHEWFLVDHLIKECGIPAMAATAVRAARRTDVDSARYFLPGWRELPPQPAPGTQRPQLRAVGGTSTTDERVAQGQALAAMFREQEQQALNPGHPQETA